ncbi:carboxyl-terminal processing protease [Carnobacterium alterfunditum]|uniref:Carboxyl-terminal processing protease n=1 Tax=Carnobacterium alterfunditum TaxID=28230 RepID=A0A1N6GWR4_9LACT|nr:S41 family peptidase [Carnobacterium alterfunditum]SIO12031.1 carboxyl-terminal processing protease [Carnobacterium alterfunditum]
MENEPKKDEKQKGIKPWAYGASLIVVAALSIGGTVAVTNANDGKDEQVQNQLNSSEASVEMNAEDFEKIQAVYDTLMTDYYQGVEEETLIEGAITGMTEAVGDPYTQYLDVEESSSLDESISASFEGIGAEVMKQGDNVMIVSPIAGSPAEKAGLQPNDIILKADDQELTGMTLNEAVSYIRGEKGSEVTLTIRRGESTFEVKVVRDTIPVETIIYQLDEENPTIGYIAITSFSSPTYDDLVAAIKDLREQGAESFVFDVRQNPGGLLNAGLNISNLFLEDGDIILQTQEKDQEPVSIVADDATMGEFKVTEPSVLLVNEGSASASEILAGAVNESGNIKLIGTQTFGKGTVQNVAAFDDSSELKITIAKWLTPSGKWINEKGITPTIEVALPEYTNLLIIDGSKSYQLGDVSEEVENLEKVLDALDYSTGAIDGYFDESTQDAVRQFQTDKNLTIDGKVTGETATQLIESLRKLIDENDTQYEAAIKELQSTKSSK